MTRVATILLTLALVLTPVLGVQAAQTQSSPAQEDCQARFKTLAGQDEQIAPQEWKGAQYGVGTMKGAGPAPGAAVDFTAVDKNGDGFISEAEYCTWARAK